MISNLFLCFLIYSFIGWVWEGLMSIIFYRKITNRGFLNGPYCPIYGIGAIMFMLLDRFLGDNLVHFCHGYISQFVDSFEHKDIIAIVAAAIFTFDVISTNQSFAKFTRILKDFQNTISQGAVIQFIQRGKNQFIAELNKRTSRLLTYPQRRLMNAFPNYKSSYDNAYREVQKLYRDTKYKPKKTAHARKKAKKIVK